jgi:hypothetical protein
MKYWIAGFFGVVTGIALLSVNFWLGVVVIGASTLTVRLFQGHATRQATALVAKKGKVPTAVKSPATLHAPQAHQAPSPDQDPIAAAMQRAIPMSKIELAAM